MILFSIELSVNAQRFLDKLDKHLRVRIEETLKSRLENNPVPSGSRFVYRDVDSNKVFRCRIGDYRALYIVFENEKIILIAKIDKRSRVYDGP